MNIYVFKSKYESEEWMKHPFETKKKHCKELCITRNRFIGGGIDGVAHVLSPFQWLQLCNIYVECVCFMWLQYMVLIVLLILIEIVELRFKNKRKDIYINSFAIVSFLYLRLSRHIC